MVKKYQKISKNVDKYVFTDYNSNMKLVKTDYIKLNVCISQEESKAAKAFAKSLGFSYQGWLGQLVKRELVEAGVVAIPESQQTYLTGTAIKEGV